MPAGSVDERPRPARAAPAESPARLALKPKAKKPRAQDDPNFIDLKTLTKGTRFTIIASLDETAYGVSSVSVRMELDEETGLAVCLEPACGRRCWSNKPESTSFYFALRHAHAFHLPGKFTIISRPLPPAAAAEGGGTTRTAQVALAPKPLRSFFQPRPPPLKSGPLYADVRANAEAAAARAPSGPSAFRTRTSTSARRRRGGRHAAWIFQFDVDSDTVPRLPRGCPRGAVARMRELSVPTSLQQPAFIYKYSMAKHFAVEHPSHEPPKEFSEVSGAEKARLAKLWRKIEAKRPAKPCV